MEDNKIYRLRDHLELPPLPAPTCAIAINGKKKSKYIVFWALEKFVPEGFTEFKLIHVRPPVTWIPTPMGAGMPITEVREDVVAAYKREMEWQTRKMLLPYKKMCLRRKVQVEILVLESDDVAAAIAKEVIKNVVSRLVLGISFRGFFSRKIDMSSMIAAATPGFCAVYVVSKGKLSSVRPSDFEENGTIKEEGSDGSSSTSSSENNPASYTDFLDITSVASDAHSRAPLLPIQRSHSVPATSNSVVPMETSSAETSLSVGMLSLDFDERTNESQGSSYPKGSEHVVSLTPKWREERRDEMSSSSSNHEMVLVVSRCASCTSMATDNNSRVSHEASNNSPVSHEASNNSRASHQASNISDPPSDFSATDNHVFLNSEIDKLRAELRNAREHYAICQSETSDFSPKLNHGGSEEAVRLEGLKLQEEEAKLMIIKEEKIYIDARKEGRSTREHAGKEDLQRREAGIKAAKDAKGTSNQGDYLSDPSIQYQHFSWQEIVAATSSFSEDLKVGVGAYGAVYKCSLHHTMAAVKVLHAGETKLSKQFNQELEILSKIRHPHLLLLLGACPERGCLVYEYMENGSLEDRLMLLNNTQPIPWFVRFRIAWEVASALLFLHKSKPRPIIHRDLKPGNILLDHNFVSKLGDVGLSTIVNADPSSKFTIYKNTSPVGTLCYIDPEYQRTGMISPKSDVYSLGMVILQLITAKPAIALTHIMEEAIRSDDEFLEMLDKKAGNWPINETRELAALGLCCTELRRRDRPDLKDQIIPSLGRLRKIAYGTHNSISKALTGPPTHFICPLLKDIMDEPCVAADGYTYDRQSIEDWFKHYDISPVTNLPLPNTNLLPNYSLQTAIMEWKSKKQ